MDYHGVSTELRFLHQFKGNFCQDYPRNSNKCGLFAGFRAKDLNAVSTGAVESIWWSLCRSQRDDDKIFVQHRPVQTFCDVIGSFEKTGQNSPGNSTEVVLFLSFLLTNSTGKKDRKMYPSNLLFSLVLLNSVEYMYIFFYLWRH